MSEEEAQAREGEREKERRSQEEQLTQTLMPAMRLDLPEGNSIAKRTRAARASKDSEDMGCWD